MSGFLMKVTYDINAVPGTILAGIPDGVFASALAVINATQTFASTYLQNKTGVVPTSIVATVQQTR